jgi:GNAT superfamily N-acetyltransferase
VIGSARPAMPGDAARLAVLLAAFRAENRSDRGGALWDQREGARLFTADPLRRAIADPDSLVLAGCIDEATVGAAFATIETLPDASRLAVLHALYVEPGAREVGVGSALLAGALTWAAAAGCCGIDAIALPGNRIAKNFFEAHGLVARAIVVHRTLERGAP